MAFAITNKAWDRMDFQGVPAVHVELADKNADVSAADLGIVGLKFMKGRIVCKSGLTNGQTANWAIRVGTGASLTAPEIIAQSPTYTFVTGDGTFTWEFIGWSNNGFQSYSIDVTNSGGTAVFDVLFDAV